MSSKISMAYLGQINTKGARKAESETNSEYNK